MIEPLILLINPLDPSTFILDADGQLSGGRCFKPCERLHIASFFSDDLVKSPTCGLYSRSFFGDRAAATACQTQAQNQKEKSHGCSPIV